MRLINRTTVTAAVFFLLGIITVVGVMAVDTVQRNTITDLKAWNRWFSLEDFGYFNGITVVDKSDDRWFLGDPFSVSYVLKVNDQETEGWCVSEPFGEEIRCGFTYIVVNEEEGTTTVTIYNPNKPFTLPSDSPKAWVQWQENDRMVIIYQNSTIPEAGI